MANTLRLLALPASVQDMVLAGALSAGHARAILTAADPEALAKRVVELGLNVRETEALAKGESGKASAPSTSKPATAKDVDTLALEKRLSDILGLAVDIKDRDGAGIISLRYVNLEQLEHVCRRLAPEA